MRWPWAGTGLRPFEDGHSWQTEEVQPEGDGGSHGEWEGTALQSGRQLEAALDHLPEPQLP